VIQTDAAVNLDMDASDTDSSDDSDDPARATSEPNADQ
jgi:hypothetical protein